MVQPTGETLNSLDADLLFEELADWEVILKGSPEVVHKLRAFEAAASETEEQAAAAIENLKRRSPTRGPSL